MIYLGLAALYCVFSYLAILVYFYFSHEDVINNRGLFLSAPLLPFVILAIVILLVGMGVLSIVVDAISRRFDRVKPKSK